MMRVAAIIPGDGSENGLITETFFSDSMVDKLRRISHMHPSYAFSALCCSLFLMVKMAGTQITCTP